MRMCKVLEHFLRDFLRVHSGWRENMRECPLGWKHWSRVCAARQPVREKSTLIAVPCSQPPSSSCLTPNPLPSKMKMTVLKHVETLGWVRLSVQCSPRGSGTCGSRFARRAAVGWRKCANAIPRRPSFGGYCSASSAPCRLRCERRGANGRVGVSARALERYETGAAPDVGTNDTTNVPHLGFNG